MTGGVQWRTGRSRRSRTGGEGAGHDLARVLGLTGDHGDVLGAGDEEGGADDALDEALEAAKSASREVLGHRSARDGPVAEAVDVALGVGADLVALVRSTGHADGRTMVKKV